MHLEYQKTPLSLPTLQERREIIQKSVEKIVREQSEFLECLVGTFFLNAFFAADVTAAVFCISLKKINLIWVKEKVCRQNWPTED